MKVYRSSVSKFSGTDYHEVYRKAYETYIKVKSKTKRKPYIRSIYFGKDKVFIDYFWNHLRLKIWPDRLRRLKYYSCALDLIRYTTLKPIIKINPNKLYEVLYRFAGVTKENDLFYVQIKEDLKTGQKWFMSVFPEQN